MDKSRVEPTLFFIEKISFSLNFFSGHFYGQSFIKTVRGPFGISTLHVCYILFKVYYVSKATLKTANKQYSSLPNDYEMTLNSETTIEPCNDEVDLPTMTFDFVKINELESKQPNAMIGKIVVRHI